MAKKTRHLFISFLVAAALALGAVQYSPAQTPGSHQGLIDAELKAAKDQGHETRTRLPMQTAALRPELTVPPLDAAVPTHTETATFGLG
jgi:hypothetical protein